MLSKDFVKSREPTCHQISPLQSKNDNERSSVYVSLLLYMFFTYIQQLIWFYINSKFLVAFINKDITLQKKKR